MFPSDLNYRMPAEWARHERTFISWPVRASMCHPENYEAVCEGYTNIIRAIGEFEPVTVLVNPDERSLLEGRFRNRQIELLPLAHNDAWLRDNGPTFIVNDQGDTAGINWHFNAWGGKYPDWDLDNQVALQILKHLGLKPFDAPLIMEGGSLHVDGDGTLLTTAECLLNPNRNPDFSREHISKLLKKYLSIHKVIWLEKGLYGDETDGHIDNIACFASPGKILIQVCDDPCDPNYAITRENLAVLSRETDARGRTFEIIPIQQPPAVFTDSKRLTLSYLNFYFVNGGIILPVFGGQAAETDALAIRTLSGIFPERRIRTIDGMAIIGEGGNVHCTTQQMPAVDL